MAIPLNPQTNVSPLRYHDKCDKYDYMTAACCGIIAGLVDVFFVGVPKNSMLGGWTDAQTDKCVMSFAKMNGWNNNGNPKSAIGFLEKTFRVNYDQRHSADVGGLIQHMSASNHHMKSLAHSPSVLGLFFSLLDQFTGTSAFASSGKLITINAETAELQGGDIASKLFCGTANWIGHLMSDVAGSSGAVGRGSGIVMPFYELFNFYTFGNFNPGGARMDLAQLATRAFEQGMDLRSGITQAIPVVLCDVLIRLLWSLRRHFGMKKPLSQCVPNDRHDDLRVMLLVGNGALCLVDGIDALIRSGGNPLAGFMRLNLIGWAKLAYLAIKEVCIRTGLALPLQRELEAFKRINAAVTAYLKELEKIDIEAFKRETESYNSIISLLNNASDEDELNKNLHLALETLGIKIPWEGYDSFDDFMDDNNSKLVFE